MKKILIGILIALLAIGGTIGVIFGVKACKENKENVHNITCDITLLEDSYAKGDLVMFKVIVTADVELTSLSYRLNNGDAVSMKVKTGESKDLDEKVGDGKYYIEANVEMIDTADMTEGYYNIVFQSGDAEGTTYKVAGPFMFELVAVTPAA